MATVLIYYLHIIYVENLQGRMLGTVRDQTIQSATVALQSSRRSSDQVDKNWSTSAW